MKEVLNKLCFRSCVVRRKFWFLADLHALRSKGIRSLELYAVGRKLESYLTAGCVLLSRHAGRGRRCRGRGRLPPRLRRAERVRPEARARGVVARAVCGLGLLLSTPTYFGAAEIARATAAASVVARAGPARFGPGRLSWVRISPPGAGRPAPAGPPTHALQCPTAERGERTRLRARVGSGHANRTRAGLRSDDKLRRRPATGGPDGHVGRWPERVGLESESRPTGTCWRRGRGAGSRLCPSCIVPSETSALERRKDAASLLIGLRWRNSPGSRCIGPGGHGAGRRVGEGACRILRAPLALPAGGDRAEPVRLQVSLRF